MGKKNVIKQKTEFTNNDQCSRRRKKRTMGLVNYELGGETQIARRFLRPSLINKKINIFNDDRTIPGDRSSLSRDFYFSKIIITGDNMEEDRPVVYPYSSQWDKI